MGLVTKYAKKTHGWKLAAKKTSALSGLKKARNFLTDLKADGDASKAYNEIEFVDVDMTFDEELKRVGELRKQCMVNGISPKYAKKCEKMGFANDLNAAITAKK